MISTHLSLEISRFPIIEKEIFNLFINGNTKFTHLYIPYQFDYQIHLIPGAKHCFSELKFLSCNASINDDVLAGLIEICQSIKELDLFINEDNNNYEIVKLIEATKKLFNVRFLTKGNSKNDSFCKILESSLIKHANTIQYFKITKQPITKILSFFVNLKRLELVGHCFRTWNFFNTWNCNDTWNCLKNLSLPFLQILKTEKIPVRALTSLIENTSGYLIEISIDLDLDEIDNKRIIQAIYQNCPKLIYLKLSFQNNGILEVLDQLLTNCQYLNGLYIIFYSWELFDWDYLFEILTKSSPTSLFKLKFEFNLAPKLESLKTFFDNWEGRHPMLLLQIYHIDAERNKYFDLIEKYETIGIIKKYNYTYFIGNADSLDDFEWI